MVLLGKFYTLFNHLRGIAICRPQKSLIGPIFFCLEANGTGLIIGFEMFGLGLVRLTYGWFVKGEVAGLLSTCGENIGFEGFASL